MEDDLFYVHIAAISSAFTPGAPIDSRDLFAGRQKQVHKVIVTIFQRGQHIVIFGDRGVGKTSLANTLFDFLVLTGKYNYQRARVNCSDSMTFEDMWRSVFKQLFFNGPDHTSTLEDLLPNNPNPENIKETFQLINDPSIVIIDEFDRVGNPDMDRMLADTVKTLSDNSIDTTLIVVGVADSVDQLIGEHHSIERAIVQIPMPPMSTPELLEIVDRGFSKCEGLSIDPAVRERLADYSQGLPTYTHLLAREAAMEAVRRGRTNITMADLEAAIKEAVDSQLETNLTAYNVAVTAPRGKNFKPVLLACALAEKDEKGYFYANAVKQPLQAITRKPYEIPAFARHLKDFSDASRGPILEKDGRRYRFLKPLMVPYVVLRGLADGLIQENQLSRPSTSSGESEQLSLRLFDVVRLQVP